MLPGERFRLHVSTTAPRFSARAFRMGRQPVEGVGVGGGAGEAAGGGAGRGRHGDRRPLGPVADRGHHRLARGRLPRQARRLHRRPALRPDHRALGLHRRSRGDRERGHHLAGVQPVGRAQPLHGPRRVRVPLPGGHLRPPLRRHRRPALPGLRGGGAGRGRAERGAACVPDEPGPRAGRAGRRPRGDLARPRRVLVARHAQGRDRRQGPRHEPRLPRRQRRLLAHRHARQAGRVRQGAGLRAVAGVGAGELADRADVRLLPGRGGLPGQQAGALDLRGDAGAALPRDGRRGDRQGVAGVAARCPGAGRVAVLVRRAGQRHAQHVLHGAERGRGVRLRDHALGVRAARAAVRPRRHRLRRRLHPPGHAQPPHPLRQGPAGHAEPGAQPPRPAARVP